MKILQIVESAYRATLEEQDDTVLWITQAMTGAGGDFSVLLRGNAVNYAIRGQDASGLSFGDWKQTEPPQIANQVSGLVGKGVEVFVVEEDAAELGLGDAEFIEGLSRVTRAGLPGLLARHDQVWHW